MTEEERIKTAERSARELVKNISPELIEKVGEENLVSDLIAEILLGMPPAQNS